MKSPAIQPGFLLAKETSFNSLSIMKSLDDLQGQPIAKRMLTSYLQRELPPLLIFHGPDGVGKYSAADLLVRQKLCEHGNACGYCIPCKKIFSDDHPDYIRFPEAPIPIGDPKNPPPFTVRWLLMNRICFAPFAGALRFIMIPRSELIQDEALTALLKTLEEPPFHTKFIFLVRSLSDLKQTIISRAVTIPFQRLSDSALRGLVTQSMPAEYIDLLGGTLHLEPFFRTPLFQTIRQKMEGVFSHPLSLSDLERWYLSSEKNFSSGLGDEEYSSEEILELFLMLLMREAGNSSPNSAALIRSIFEFKGDLHRDIPGLTPYLMSRFFHKLSMISFSVAAPKRS